MSKIRKLQEKEEILQRHDRGARHLICAAGPFFLIFSKSVTDNRHESKSEEIKYLGRTAYWTKILGIFTIVVAAVGVITLGVFLGQLRVAQSAADDAHNAYVVTQRAFVDPKAIDYRCNSFGCAFTAEWENAGTTPTKNLFLNINAELVDINQSAGKYAFEKSKFHPGIMAVIGPKEMVRSDIVVLPPDALKAILKNRKQFWIWGSAEYADIFPRSKHHITEFAYNVIPMPSMVNEIGNNRRIAGISEFWMPLLSRHNCSDDECARK